MKSPKYQNKVNGEAMGMAAIAARAVASQVAQKECVNVEFSFSTAFQSHHGVKRLLLNIPVRDCEI